MAGQILYRRFFLPRITNQNQKTYHPVEEVLVPKRIIIPKLNIDTEVEAVGLDENGSMDVPSNPWTVGWYKYGASLEKTGSVVIGGHLDSKTGPAVFYRLSSLAAGDEVMVIDQNGKGHSFLVVKKEIYSEEQFPSEKVFFASDKKRLNLITCRGTFDKKKQKYDKRIVVFTESKNS